MDVKKGIPISPGIVIGEVYILDSDHIKVNRRFIAGAEIDDEFNRFQQAVEKVKINLQKLQEDARRHTGWEELQQIFAAHIMILSDQKMHDEVWQRISKNRFSVEYAVMRVLAYYKDRFAKSGNPYISQRVSDLNDIENALLALLLDERRENLAQLHRAVVLVGHDISPSIVATVNRDVVLGFATDVGGRTSHNAIVARAREIPAVAALEDLSRLATEGETIIIDGNTGRVVLSPDEATLTQYRRAADEFNRRQTLIMAEHGEAVTLDGARIKICINIEFPSEIIGHDRQLNDGIGLYRTEFLFLSLQREPAENDHFVAYKQALDTIGAAPLTIRTYDLGADKLFHLNTGGGVTWERSLINERNPALGCRAIRLGLQHPEILRPQIRAICRVAALGKGNVRAMLPMVCCRDEVVQFREMLQKEIAVLRDEGVVLSQELPVGIMVEVPAVAMNLDNFVDICDFFSIGTNDLTQYAMGVDRGNEHVSELYRPANIGVLRLIKQTLTVAKEYDREISICGEIAGDPLFTYLLLGLGLRNFSVAPPRIPEIRKLVRSVSLPQAATIAADALQLKSSSQVMAFLRENVRRLLPDYEFNRGES
ncbi:phosphoenolpyruvate-protein phosphotransferase [Planctomycetales bacterium]|nr:phosphoenolpyruvate-protein phosphotransferase [Planctomycetales bacterium]GHT06962.1 phosphoenolpyruvate-protein phosphotransferase [Planctomycetales bacterium]